MHEQKYILEQIQLATYKDSKYKKQAQYIKEPIIT